MASITWTTAKPTTPGWYWFQPPGMRVRIVEVKKDDRHSLYVVHSGMRLDDMPRGMNTNGPDHSKSRRDRFMAHFLIADEGRDEEKDLYVAHCVYGPAGKPIKNVITGPALTYLKKEITPRLSDLVGRAIDAAELLMWENEEVVLVEMGGGILHEMMVQFRQEQEKEPSR